MQRSCSIAGLTFGQRDSHLAPSMQPIGGCCAGAGAAGVAGRVIVSGAVLLGAGLEDLCGMYLTKS